MPVFSAPLAMDVESAASYQTALQWWRWPAGDADAARFFEGLSWYLQGRTVERQFDLAHGRPGHSVVTARLFGGAVPWVFSFLTVDRGAADGWLLRQDGATPVWSRDLPATLPIAAAREAIAFSTVEQLIGWPSLQGALHVLAERAGKEPVSRGRAVELLSDATGQDLSDALTFRSIDYSIAAVTTQAAMAPCPPAGCIRTLVEVHRRGDLARSAEALEVRVTFLDEQVAATAWDGSTESERFEFASSSPASVVEIDPRRVLRMDTDPLNNRVVVSARQTPSTGKWLSAWAVWLQDASLAYSFLF